MNVIYFNGLTNGETRLRERVAFNHLRKRGLKVEHHNINWRSDKTFNGILLDAIAATQHKLDEEGETLLVGTSSGGSLAVNVFQNLQRRKGLYAINICGRLISGGPGTKPSLSDAARYDGEHTSQSFIDSVIHCEHVALRFLEPKNKKRLAVVQQQLDRVVPPNTVEIPDVVTHKMLLGLGHGASIAFGVLALPQIISELVDN